MNQREIEKWRKTVYLVAEGVRSMHSKDGAVVLDIRHGQVFSLNLVGSKIVELLKEGYSEQQIAERISQEFGVAREIAEADVREFLESLEKHRLVEINSSTGQV